MFLDPGVRVKNNLIYISFIPRDKILNDIKRILETSRVNNYMFVDQHLGSLTIPEFFALELYFIIDILLEESSRTVRTSVRQLKAIQRGLKEKTWLQNIDKPIQPLLNLSQLNQFHFKPLKHQQEFLTKFEETIQRYNVRGMLLAAGAGTGKTFTALTLAACLNVKRTLVISPKPALERVWLRSIASDANDGGLYHRPRAVHSSAYSKPYQNESMLVFHYEALDKLIELAPKFKNDSVLIILDESHSFNEIKSQRTQKFLDLCNLLPDANIVMLSGTPIKAYSIETIPLFKAIDPLFTQDVLERFKRMYSGSVNATTEILKRRYNLVSHTVNKSVLEMTDPVQTTINLTIPNSERFTLPVILEDIRDFVKKRTVELELQKPAAIQLFERALADLEAILITKRDRKTLAELAMYRSYVLEIQKAYRRGSLYPVVEQMTYCTKFEKNVIIPSLPKELKEPFKEAKTLVKYLSLKVRGEALGRILGRRRIDAFVALVDGVPFEDIIESTEKKTVIFTTYADVIKKTLDVLVSLKYKPIAVYGEETKNLSSIVKKFEEDESVNPLVTTYASLSTAVPLIMADTMIILNAPFRFFVLNQTIARIHRLGQKSNTRIFNMNLDTKDVPNIATRSLDIMMWSKEQVNAIIGMDLSSSDEDDIALECMDLANELAIIEKTDKPVIQPMYSKW